MTTRSTKTAGKIDPDPLLVKFDFAETAGREPEEALALLDILLHDCDSCLYRIGELLAVAGRAGLPFPSKHDRETKERHGLALAFVARLIDSPDEEKPTEEQLDALHRLTCDPDALYLAHRLATAPAVVNEPSEDTAVAFADAGETGIIASGPAKVDDRSEAETEALEWREAFARIGIDAGAGVAAAAVEAAAVDLELRHSQADDTAVVRRFRELALEARLRTVPELRQFSPDELKGIDWLPVFRDQLADQAEERRRVGRRLFGEGMTLAGLARRAQNPRDQGRDDPC